MVDTTVPAGHGHDEGGSRRDFLLTSSIVVGGAGVIAAALPFIDYMNPSADVLALASLEFDISGVEVGQAITVSWRSKPVFIRHRTPKEIAEAEDTPLTALKDPQTDEARVEKPEWLIVVGICTHLGCIPKGQAPGDPKGEYGGWFCPCHGSQYDTSGRIRSGPAPRNLVVPPYEFVNDTTVRIG